jgi:hypothetical protein
MNQEYAYFSISPDDRHSKNIVSYPCVSTDMMRPFLLSEIPPCAESAEEKSQDNDCGTGKLDIYYFVHIINDE